VRSLAAGADALLLGSAIDESHVAAVASGELAEERVLEAAARVRELGLAAAAAHPAEDDRSVGAEAAVRALVVEGDVHVGAAPLVVELAPEPGMAAGPALHGLGGLLPGAEVVTLSTWPAEVDPGERDLVVVARDAARYPWQREALAALLAIRPDTVVVETGLDNRRPPAANRYIATRGAGRVNLEAAAAALAG